MEIATVGHAIHRWTTWLTQDRHGTRVDQSARREPPAHPPEPTPPVVRVTPRPPIDLPTEPAADLEARLMGPFEARYMGQDLAPWRSQRAASLLKLLLLHRARPVRREVLMDAFWPASSAKSARNNLNVTVYQLRRQLRERNPDRTHVEYAAGSYAIAPDLSCRVDVEEYASAVLRAQQSQEKGDSGSATAWYLRARALYAGPLLEGDTSGDWFLDAQRRLHLDHCAVLERLCGMLLDSGDAGEAAATADELLCADPLRETGYQLLMRAYAALAQPQLVAQQFRRCQTMMRRDLAIEPSPATVELYRGLMADGRAGHRHG